jgi:hypothetical protein
MLAITARLWGLTAPSSLIAWTKGADPQSFDALSVGRMEIGLTGDGTSGLAPQWMAETFQPLDLTPRPIQVTEILWQPRVRPRGKPKTHMPQIDVTQFAI